MQKPPPPPLLPPSLPASHIPKTPFHFFDSNLNKTKNKTRKRSKLRGQLGLVLGGREGLDNGGLRVDALGGLLEQLVHRRRPGEVAVGHHLDGVHRGLVVSVRRARLETPRGVRSFVRSFMRVGGWGGDSRAIILIFLVCARDTYQSKQYYYAYNATDIRVHFGVHLGTYFPSSRGNRYDAGFPRSLKKKGQG